MINVNLSQFLTVIQSLSLGEYVQPSQLPPEITHTLSQLVGLSEQKAPAPMLMSTFEQFFTLLVHAANPYQQNLNLQQKNCAKYLLEFLLHQKMQLTFDDHNFYALEKLALSVLLGAPSYPTQAFPSMEYLQMLWQNHATQMAQLAQEEDFEEAIAAYEKEQAALEYKQWRDQHHFDDVTLNSAEFCQILEVFLLRGPVKLSAELGFNDQPGTLSSVVSRLLRRFHQATTCAPQSLVLLETLRELLRSLFTQAKYAPAEQHLLGFLLYHNFKIQLGQQQISIINIFWDEITPLDRHEILQGKVAYPFMDQVWQAQQGYPGKSDIVENVRSRHHPETHTINQTYTVSYNQRVVQQTAVLRRSANIEETQSPRAARTHQFGKA